MSDAVCTNCGAEVVVPRDGLCLPCWYRAPSRPKPVRDRFATLQELVAEGFAPYAYAFERSHTLREAPAVYEEAEREGRLESAAPVRVAGRILSMRDLGGTLFAHLGDRDGRLQLYFKRDLLDERTARLLEHLHLGDWIGVEGPLFRTRAGEVTVRVEALELLSKTLRPLPLGKEEIREDGRRVVHSGFSDREARYRRRYVDLAVHPEVRERFLTRGRLVTALRRFLDRRGFVEVETPILQPQYGGAFARPFTTRHEELDTTLYLRIADELYLKRLIVGNLDRVYEIGKDFRNEGADRTHNPEFTMLELYQAFADYEEMMTLAEEMVSEALLEVLGRLELEYEGEPVRFEPPWRRMSFAEALAATAGIDSRSATVEELRAAVQAVGRTDADELPRHKLLDILFSAHAEPAFRDPTIVYDYPKELSPLAKPKRGDPSLAERFEVIAGGHEIINAFSELNDPLDQWERFARQAREREAGDLEAQSLDEDYVRALEYGLPPTGGLGLGVDRLTMLATGQGSIREVILYPILRADEGR